MDQDTRARIRHLYFVERMPLREIAEALALAPQAVRAALVLPGGDAERRDPEPLAMALDAPAIAPTRRRITQRLR